MTFQDLFSQPRDGHELITLDLERGVSWCLRCGALCLDARPRLRDRTSWEAPTPAGRSRETEAAPACIPAADAGAVNFEGDARLMLHALTHGWRCEPVLLHGNPRTEAWRWSHEGPLGGEAWSVHGAWAEGPIVDDTVRRLLLTSSNVRPPLSGDR